MKPVTCAPVFFPSLPKDSDRIQGYDLARGIAIVAMVMINTKAVFSPADTDPLWLSRAIYLMDRRAAVILVMLAGAGIALHSGQNGLSGMWALVNRAIFLFLGGTLFSWIWDADILHFYGVYLFIGLCFMTLSHSRVLAGAGLFCAGGIFHHLEPVSLFVEALDPDSIVGYFADLLFTGFYPVFPWAAFFLVGMWVGRQNVRNPRVSGCMLAAGCLMLALPLLFSVFVSVDSDLSASTPWSIPSGIGTGLCVIALSMFGADHGHRPWVAFLSLAGKNTLSLYVLHILFMRGIGLVPGISGQHGIVGVVGGSILFILAYMILMKYWLGRYNRGPLEIMMRRFCLFRGKSVNETGPLASH